MKGYLITIQGLITIYRNLKRLFLYDIWLSHLQEFGEDFDKTYGILQGKEKVYSGCLKFILFF